MDGQGRVAFDEAVEFLLATVARVRPDQWDGAGLGVWSVRELVGHAGRALSTVEEYSRLSAGAVEIESATAYLGALGAVDHEAVAARGRAAGEALGTDPYATLDALARRVSAILDSSRSDSPIEVKGGAMRLGDYLETRTFELLVHGLDLARALGTEPEPPARALAAAIGLAVAVATNAGHGVELLDALTGRSAPGAPFSIL